MCKKITGGDITKGTYYEVLIVDQITDGLWEYGITRDTRKSIETILSLNGNQAIQNATNYLQPYDTTDFKIKHIEDAIKEGKDVKTALGEILALNRSGLNSASQNQLIPSITITKEYRNEKGSPTMYFDNIPASNVIPAI